MKKLTLLGIIALLLLTQIPHSLAENDSQETDRIEIGENCKTIYYEDGSKEIFVTALATLHFSTSANAIVSKVVSPQPPSPIDIIDRVFKIIQQVLDSLSSCGVGCTHLAFTIWNVIKRLRRGRPRDYHNVSSQK